MAGAEICEPFEGAEDSVRGGRLAGIEGDLSNAKLPRFLKLFSQDSSERFGINGTLTSAEGFA